MARARSSSPARGERKALGSDSPNPVWFKPIMFGFMLLGLVWIIVFYISSGAFPLPLGAENSSWNILIGFGIAFIGFVMTLWWR